MERALRVPLLAKLAGANILIVLAALAGVAAERWAIVPGTASTILAMALAASLVVNLALVYVALRPLADLAAAMARVAAGDLGARATPSALADRDMVRTGETLNALLDRLTEDRDRARRLAAQVISAQDEERARVARELHDSTAQILTAIMLQLGVAAQESTTPEITSRIALLRELAAEALEDVRSLAHVMHPRVLDDLGLAAALEWLGRKLRTEQTIDVQVSADDMGEPLPGALASVLYRVAQEATRNAIHHSGAPHIEVRLTRDAGSATLQVIDNGHGFDMADAEARRPGMGLFSMRERVALVNGTFTVVSAPQQGTRVTATVPVPQGEGSVGSRE